MKALRAAHPDALRAAHPDALRAAHPDGLPLFPLRRSRTNGATARRPGGVRGARAMAPRLLRERL